MKKGIIFDVDGTLWDGTRAITDSWNAFRMENIPELPEPFTEKQMQSVLGKTMTEIGDIILERLPEDRRYIVMEKLLQYEVDYMWEHGGEVYPGVVRMMPLLKEMGYHLYIVSNCQKGYIEDFLHTASLEEIIEDHVCFGDTLAPKSESINLCFSRNALDMAIYVGDTQGDLDAVMASKLPRIFGKYPFIHAGYGFGSIEKSLPCLPSIQSFCELLELIREIDKQL